MLAIVHSGGPFLIHQKDLLMRRLARRNHRVEIEDIANALITSGYNSLNDQAQALGLHRSTAWTIIKAKHKLGRLSTKTTERILANQLTPPSVRALVQQYLLERSDRFEQDE